MIISIINSSVAVLNFKNWGGGDKYGTNQNNVRTFFFTPYNCFILYNIYKLHYFCYIFYESPLVRFIFQNLLFASLFPKKYLTVNIFHLTKLYLGKQKLGQYNWGGGGGGQTIKLGGGGGWGNVHCCPDVEPPL